MIGGCLLIFCFKSTKERVTLQKSEEKIKFTDIFEQFRVNRPLVVLSIFFIIIFGVNSISNSVGIYYVTYNLEREDLVKWYGLIGSLPALVILPFIPRLHQFLGKKKLLNYALLLNIIGLLALLFVPPSNVYLILVCRLIAAAGSLTAGDICGRLFLKQLNMESTGLGKEWVGSFTL